jgi:hypothetical protein
MEMLVKFTNVEEEEELFNYERKGVLQVALQLHFVIAMTISNSE